MAARLIRPFRPAAPASRRIFLRPMLVGVTLLSWAAFSAGSFPMGWLVWLVPVLLFALLFPIAGWFWAQPGFFAPLALLYAMFAMPLLVAWLFVAFGAIRAVASGDGIDMSGSGFGMLASLAACSFGGWELYRAALLPR